MAVILLKHYERYIGLSTDVKPVNGVPRGSTFFEEDTSKLYAFDGAAWVEKRGQVNAQLSGSSVVIGGVAYAVSGGSTLRNTAANKPGAAAAHAVIPFCYYFSVDTGAVEVTDGLSWVVI